MALADNGYQEADGFCLRAFISYPLRKCCRRKINPEPTRLHCDDHPLHRHVALRVEDMPLLQY